MPTMLSDERSKGPVSKSKSDEMMARADRMQQEMAADHERYAARGPAVGSRRESPEALAAAADKMGRDMRAEHEQYMARGPAVSASREDLGAAADRMGQDMRNEHDLYMAQGPAVDPMADANRAQAGSIYTYRPGFDAASGQAPGEANVGPMAQTMAADPLASTAVKSDPSTGLLMLDRDKLSKLQSAGIASLQRQVDQLHTQRGGY
jgi:hypothetical protein